MTSFSKISPVTDFESELARADDFDLALTVAVIYAAQIEVVHQQKLHKDLIAIARKEQKNRRYYRRKTSHREAEQDDPSCRQFLFPSWSELIDTISDNIFRRKYRMTKDEFRLLCTRIKAKVGEKVFQVFRPDHTSTRHSVSGETKVAIGLRLLCGGSYLDLIGRAYGVEAPSTVYRHFHTFIKWIEETFSFPLVDILDGLDRGSEDAIQRLREMSADFSADSNGTFSGCIGAVDGLAIRIKCPSNVNDPGNFFCCKNCYTLNVQKTHHHLWILCVVLGVWLHPGLGCQLQVMQLPLRDFAIR